VTAVTKNPISRCRNFGHPGAARRRARQSRSSSQM